MHSWPALVGNRYGGDLDIHTCPVQPDQFFLDQRHPHAIFSHLFDSPLYHVPIVGMYKIAYRFADEFLGTGPAQEFYRLGVDVDKRPLDVDSDGFEGEFHQTPIAFFAFS